MMKLFKNIIGALLSFVLLLAIFNPLVFGFGAMVGGSSDVALEDQTDYADIRISLADGQSWFGGDNLGAEVHTSANAASDPNGNEANATTGMSPVPGSLTLSSVADPAVGTWAIKGVGATGTNDRIEIDLTVTSGILYKVSLNAKRGAQGTTQIIRAWTGVTSSPSEAILLSTYQSYTYYITTNSTALKIRVYAAAEGGAVGDEVLIDNLSVRPVTSPADFADSGHLIEVTDGSGFKAHGYIGEAGTGETLGIELLSNPSFDANTTGWTPGGSAVLASVAGGVSNNSLRITENGEANPAAYDGVITVANKEYKGGVWVKQGTEATYRAYFDFTTYSDAGYNSDQEATATWVRKEWYGVAFDTAEVLNLSARGAGAGETVFFDEASVKEVTEPNPNSVMIYKESHLATEGWLSIDGSFDPNDIVSFIIFG